MLRQLRATGVIASLFLVSCSTVPTQLRGHFTQVDVSRATSGEGQGSQVRWGGVIVGRRQIDDNECLEVAASPSIDGSTGRPLEISGATYGNAVDPVFPTIRRGKVPPHYLACGGSLQRSDYSRGALVTLVGVLEANRTFQVSRESCNGSITKEAHGSPPRAFAEKYLWESDYSGSSHTTNDQNCVVTLPVLSVAEAYAWKEPPNTNMLFGAEQPAGPWRSGW
jgi:hypothetical protein